MKPGLKTKAITLRRNGYSINDIAKTLGVSESTTSLWCRNVVLTTRQQEKLEKRKQRKLKKFFALVAEQKAKRDRLKERVMTRAQKEVGVLSSRDLFIAGIALYWAEGFKHFAESRVGFCNSDPAMMKFMVAFLKKCLAVKTADLSPRLTLNEAFKDQATGIQQYWSNYLGIPESQFTRPFYQKVKLVKVHANQDSYRGVLRIHVKKSSKLLQKMRGYLQGLKEIS